jgi:hypothetical protein
VGNARKLSHSKHQVMLLVDHKGDVQVGGCALCLSTEKVIAVLEEALDFVKANPQGHDRLDGRW